MATAHPDASPPAGQEGLLETLESTEFGAPRAAPGPRYGWLGAKQRPAEASGVVLMGVRLYVVGIGRFLQIDPVVGGSANAYDYAAQSPLNNLDLDGRICFSCAFRTVGRALGAVGLVAGGVALVAATGGWGAAGLVALKVSSVAYVGSAAAYAAAGRYRAASGSLISAGLGRFSSGRYGRVASSPWFSRARFYGWNAFTFSGRAWWTAYGWGRS